MRFVAMILGILGAAASAFLGMTWLSDAKENEAALAMASAVGMGDEVSSLINAAYTLLGGAVLGLIGAFFAFKAQRMPAALAMLIGGLAPAIFEPKALVFSGVLALGGVLAFAIKPTA